MSLIMTQTEHYPLNNHENSPTQSAIGYINNFPPANQWQQMNNSPNSMQNGSPMNPAMLPNSSINMPAAPSPLLNSMSNNSMLSNQQNMGMAGTPQQPGSVKTPLSVQQQQSNAGSLMLRNPFEEDLESRPASRQQMPPPTSNNQRLYFDMIKEFKAQLYCLNNDPMIRFRLPMAYNTKGTDQLKYPTTNINRSLSVVQKPALPTPQMPPMQMPVTSSAPAQPATKRRTTKKQKEQQQQEQLQSPQLNGMSFPHGISPMALEMNRPCSSHDLSNCDPRARNSPGSIPMHIKALGRSPSMPDAFPHMARSIKLMPHEKCATENQPCNACSVKITSERRGIRCTAMGQGCFCCYHIDCAGLNLEAYNQLLVDPRCEWVCINCQKLSTVIYHA